MEHKEDFPFLYNVLISKFEPSPLFVFFCGNFLSALSVWRLKIRIDG